VNVLDTLAAEVVSCANHAENRPYKTVAPWQVQALYFNGNGDDPVFEAEHEAIAGECEYRGIAFCIWLNVPRTADGGRAFAESSSRKVEHYGGAARVQAVMFDNEKVPLAFQDEFMPRWDELRPFRPTLYSVEPIQDESINRYALMLRRNTRAPGQRVRKVTFQCYGGGMQPYPPLGVRTSKYGVGHLGGLDLCPTIDPAQPRAYVGSAAACGLMGLMLFETGRMVG